MAIRRILFLCCLILTACGSLPTLTQPPPESLNVDILPSLFPLFEVLQSCADKFPQIALFLREIPATSIDLTKADLVIWLGEKPGFATFATPIAGDKIAVIVHPDNELADLGLQDLKGIFSGAIKNWEQLGSDSRDIVVWIYPNGNEIRRSFQDVVLPGQSFGPFSSLAPSPATMLQSVASNPGAIGILPGSWLDDSVKVISLESDLQTQLHLPLLALARSEPQGNARLLLNCMQNPEIQAILNEKYLPLK